MNGNGDIELVEFRPRLPGVDDHVTAKSHASEVQPGGQSGWLTSIYLKFRRASGHLAPQGTAEESGPDKRVQFLAVYKVCGIAHTL